MSLFSRIQGLLGLRPTPIRHNHTYVDTITGESFEIASVGRKVSVIRQDYERVEENDVPKSTMRTAISRGIVEHDTDRCPTCRNDV